MWFTLTIRTRWLCTRLKISRTKRIRNGAPMKRPVVCIDNNITLLGYIRGGRRRTRYWGWGYTESTVRRHIRPVDNRNRSFEIRRAQIRFSNGIARINRENRLRTRPRVVCRAFSVYTQRFFFFFYSRLITIRRPIKRARTGVHERVRTSYPSSRVCVCRRAEVGKNFTIRVRVSQKGTGLGRQSEDRRSHSL